MTPSPDPLPIETSAAPTSDGDFVSSLTARLADAFKEESSPTPAPEAAADPTPAPDAKATPTADDVIKAADEAIEKEGKMPRANAWTAVKEKAAAAEAKAAAALAELESLKKTPVVDEGTKAELEALKAKLAAQEDKIKAVDVESSEEFQKLVNIPAKQVYADLTELAKRNELKVEELWEAMTENDVKKRNAALSDIASTLNAVESQEMFTLARELQQVSATRENLLSNSAKAFEELEARRVRQAVEAKQSRVKEWSSSTEEVWNAVVAKVQDLPASIKEQALALDPTNIPSRNQAYNAIAGFALPEVLKRQAATAKELAEVKTALSKLQKASPGTPSGVSPAESAPVSEGGFMENLMSKLKQA
jgi:hypothetical protein